MGAHRPPTYSPLVHQHRQRPPHAPPAAPQQGCSRRWRRSTTPNRTDHPLTCRSSLPRGPAGAPAGQRPAPASPPAPGARQTAAAQWWRRRRRYMGAGRGGGGGAGGPKKGLHTSGSADGEQGRVSHGLLSSSDRQGRRRENVTRTACSTPPFPTQTHHPPPARPAARCRRCRSAAARGCRKEGPPAVGWGRGRRLQVAGRGWGRAAGRAAQQHASASAEAPLLFHPHAAHPVGA